MRVAGPLLDFPTELKNRLFPLKVCNPSHFLHIAQQHCPKLCLVALPYLHALFGQRYFVHDILNLLMMKMSTLAKTVMLLMTLLTILVFVEQRE